MPSRRNPSSGLYRRLFLGEVICGGFLPLPGSALPAMTLSKTIPPMNVFKFAVSPRNNQNQSGLSRTSVRDNKASPAAGNLSSFAGLNQLENLCKLAATDRAVLLGNFDFDAML